MDGITEAIYHGLMGFTYDGPIQMGVVSVTASVNVGPNIKSKEIWRSINSEGSSGVLPPDLRLSNRIESNRRKEKEAEIRWPLRRWRRKINPAAESKEEEEEQVVRSRWDG
jgi:hypothetical protein